VDDMDWLIEPQVWAGLLTLTALEIVLGIDNLVFIAVLVARARAAHRTTARRLGLGLALGMRLVLLSGISWIADLTSPVLVAAGHEFSWRDLILIAGGLFLVYKGTVEIHALLLGEDIPPVRRVTLHALGRVMSWWDAGVAPEGVSGFGSPRPQPAGEVGTEFPAPVSNLLVGHDPAALGQDQCDVAQAEAEDVIHPD
jgi:Integral membrane protein TerC family